MLPERRSQRERLALRGALLRLTPPLETIAEDVLGLVSRIDLVTRDPDGAVTLVLVAGDGADLARPGAGIAPRGWLSPRLPDWNQLAPHPGSRRSARPACCWWRPASTSARASRRAPSDPSTCASPSGCRAATSTSTSTCSMPPAARQRARLPWSRAATPG